MTSIILWILIPIAILMAVLLSALLYIASIRKRKVHMIETLSFEIKKERMTKIDSILNRVRIISGMNESFVQLFNELSNTHTEINKKVDHCLNILGSLTLSSKTTKMSQFESKAAIIRSNIDSINFLQHEFEVKAERITQQDDFMAAEIGFYTNNLRKAINVYRQKRILLTKVAPKLDELSQTIKDLEKSFNKELDQANIKQANMLLEKYSHKVAVFTEIINEGPSIESYIYKNIPELVQKIMENYKAKKAEVGGGLEHINFAKSIQDIGNKYKKAKLNYLNLRLDKAKKGVKSILKSLKILERLINFEITSRNVFVNNYETLIDETKRSLMTFVTIKKQIKALAGRGVQMSAELIEEYNTLTKESKVLDQMAMAFRDTMKSKDISYSAKIQRMKLLIQKNKYFVGLVNDITTSIWSHNVEKLITKNKFRKAEGALNEIVAATKKDKLVLTRNEQEEFDQLSHDLSKLAPSIAEDRTSKQLTESVNNIVAKTINYYQAVGGKIQIAEIVRNMIKELSSKRAMDLELNTQLGAAENYYLKGGYDAALNLIITHLEEVR